MKFSPLLITSLIIQPLRYFFSEFGPNLGYNWSDNEKERNIEIDHYYNLKRVALEERPRILVNRGTYKIAKTGLTDNMANSKGVSELKGLTNRNNLVFIDGTATVTIEARNLGTAEILADMVSHFIVWTRPLICDTQGFKEFGLDCMVGEVRPDVENTEKFIVNISVPYYFEEMWKINNDGVKLKSILMDLVPGA